MLSKFSTNQLISFCLTPFAIILGSYIVYRFSIDKGSNKSRKSAKISGGASEKCTSESSSSSKDLNTHLQNESRSKKLCPLDNCLDGRSSAIYETTFGTDVSRAGDYVVESKSPISLAIKNDEEDIACNVSTRFDASGDNIDDCVLASTEETLEGVNSVECSREDTNDIALSEGISGDCSLSSSSANESVEDNCRNGINERRRANRISRGAMAFRNRHNLQVNESGYVPVRGRGRSNSSNNGRKDSALQLRSSTSEENTVDQTELLSSEANHEIIWQSNIPQSICPILIGKKGRSINYLKEQTGTKITVRSPEMGSDLDFQSLRIKGTFINIHKALTQLEHKFPNVDFSLGMYHDNDFNMISPVASPMAMLNPDSSQLSLPEFVQIDVVLAAVVSAGHIFVQQHTHPTFTVLVGLDKAMTDCYCADGGIPGLPLTSDIGTICASPNGIGSWSRSQLVTTVDLETGSVRVKSLDYGGFTTVPFDTLKQIRADFITLPFQACEVVLANIQPINNNDDFSLGAKVFVEELTRNKRLIVEATGCSMEGHQQVDLYCSSDGNLILINHELVVAGHAQWLEA